MLEGLRQYWVYLLFIVFLGIGLLPVRLSIRLYRAPNEVKVNSRLTFWILPLQINMVNPVTKVFWNLSVNRPWQKEAPPDLPASRVSWRRLFRRSLNVTKIFLPVWQGANRLFLQIGKPIKIRELTMYTEIGLEDAAVTALSVGMAWSLLGAFYSRLGTLFNTRGSQNNIVVVPHFQNEFFLLMDYSCIFEFRLGHIIIIIYHIFHSAGEIYRLVRRVSE